MRYLIRLSYHGKNYFGWQIQPDQISVQQKIQEGLSLLLREEILILGAGRTDSGVHAKEMYAHFDLETQIDSVKIKNRLNSYLPEDIVIYTITNVKLDFHARFDAISRSYEYKIYLGKSPFHQDSSWQLYNKKLNIDLMNEAAAELLNHIDFQCFSKSNTDVYTYNCTITNAKWVLNNDELIFHISANRFLRNMVRAIVGTLIDIGTEKINFDDFVSIIKSKDRSNAGVSVPAKGLYLTKVEYPNVN